jgi:hypothetical protein
LRLPCAPAAEACAERVAVLALDADAGVGQAQAVHGGRQRVKVATAGRVDACARRRKPFRKDLETMLE